MKIAVYGAAFNPPHKGHMDAVSQLLEEFELVFLVPSVSHAFGKNMLPVEERMEMLGIIISEFYADEKRIKVENIESEVQESLGSERVYSYDLLSFLNSRNPENQFVLAIGPDNARPEIWNKFYKNREIEDEFGFFVVSERKPIRSTYVRDLCLDEYKNLTEMLGERLAGHIINRGYYS
ncbi:MAG: nicotinate-nicotinamide nucleotide adenylyltransferase [Gammaproteobacteria bacterium]|nr:MAG: nicotinate-nicotinamide nucleotide adenylyltransferase [Gammaproteobacteria bacterium]